MKSTQQATTADDQNPIRAVVNVNAGAYNAQKQVNIEIMHKIGQLVIALRPEELVVVDENIYWKVPLCVVNLTGSEEKYPLQAYALVDAISPSFQMSDELAQEITNESRKIILALYPEMKAWEKRVRDSNIVIKRQ